MNPSWQHYDNAICEFRHRITTCITEEQKIPYVQKYQFQLHLMKEIDLKEIDRSSDLVRRIEEHSKWLNDYLKPTETR